MAAFLVLTIGKSREMGRRIAEKFRCDNSSLSPASWIVRAENGTTPRDIAERIEANACQQEVMVVELDATKIHGHAEPALWAWIERAVRGN